MVDLEQLLLTISAQMGNQQQSNNPLIGYDEPYMGTRDIDPTLMIRGGLGAPHYYTEEIERRDPVFFDDITEILSNLDDDDKNVLALEMFAAGVYDDINDMYGDDLQRDERVFNAMVENTINLASQGTELGFDTTFLKILLGAGQTEMPDILKRIADSKDAAAAARRGGGRVIQWADPEGLVRALKDEAKGTLGRTASKAEQRKFVQRIHNMQAKGMSVNVGAQAEVALRESSPVEAGAMDYNAARNSVMQVIMGRLGRVQ
ncbi:MAG: hypothetical protein L7S55_04770 [Luminiphilus sp.]|nr:hypothetical protein [Luminiphilus sp.]